ncbi:hypothetical protein BDB01DRAFT_833157 [Pilobolus umbonatus]|nr:hypothetical protein BDB01DRAFT_833157 [Pilobolus umbonatus]
MFIADFTSFPTKKFLLTRSNDEIYDLLTKRRKGMTDLPRDDSFERSGEILNEQPETPFWIIEPVYYLTTTEGQFPLSGNILCCTHLTVAQRKFLADHVHVKRINPSNYLCPNVDKNIVNEMVANNAIQHQSSYDSPGSDVPTEANVNVKPH